MRWNLKTSIDTKENEQAAQELKILEDDIAIAYNFLRQNRKKYFQGKSKLPIHLIFGPSRFGKSTLLSQTGLNLIDVNHQPVGNVNPTKYCTFWFTADAIYIDTAGNYTKPETSHQRHDLIWRGFIQLLQKYFGKTSIAEALIILDLPAIAQDKDLLKKTLFCIQERVYETATLVGNLRTHIIFTKCDKIAGFTDFFALLDTKERLQPFGISFDNSTKFALIPTFETKFNELLKNLNNRVIDNLQKSSDPKKRSLIKMFPSQLDNIRQTFIEVLDKIPSSRNLQLSGIYFTSSIQAGAPIDPIKTNSLPPLNLKEKSTYALEANNIHSYFVEDIFKKALHSPRQQTPLNLNYLQPRIEYFYAFLIAALIIGASTFIGYHNFHKNIRAINQTKHALQTNTLDNHDSLYTTLNQLQQTPKSWWLALGIDKNKDLHQSLIKTHRILFVKNLATQLESHLNRALNDKKFDPRNTFSALQVYLMLGTPKKLDKTYVTTWFNNQKNISQQQLEFVLQHKFKVELNQHLIASVRSSFATNQMMYILLESNYANRNLDINTLKPISKMYTNEMFHKIYDEAIPNIVKNPPEHHWILGNLKLQFEEKAIDRTIKDLREKYIDQYATTWENSIRSGIKIEFKNLKQAAEYLDKLASNKDSPLITLLQQLKHNTTIENAPPKLTKELDTRFKVLNTIDLTELQRNLDNVTNYITTIANASDPNQAAFAAIVAYSQDNTPKHPLTALKIFTNNQPPLLQLYLQSISSNIWQILLDTSYEHINQVWNQIVIPKYEETLAKKYPVFKESTDDIKLDDFNAFFAPKGVIDKFFNQYIKPLVNIDKTNWSWRDIHEQKVSFPKDALEIFLRAALIQKMFYADKASTPKIHFTLTPVDMTPNTINFNLNIDGQKISFVRGEDKKNRNLNWPGSQPGTVTIDFINNQGKNFSTSETGPWAWFRILDKANVTATHSTKHFELTFDLNGNAAKYLLSTTDPVNPFIPEIINDFRCQDHLD